MIEVRNLKKAYVTDQGPVEAVREISFEVRQGDFYTLLGPSGCGKTTTLRCIAGLEVPDEGEIIIGNDLVFSSSGQIAVPAYRRHIAMVFQSYAIWPHMTVFDNVAYPLVHGRYKIARKLVKERVAKALSLVQLDGLEQRPAPYLSGGQQQRVALARALVYEPKVLLLDEPLSNLDAKLREEMRVEVKQLAKSLGITVLYVTHDQTEALSMSDRVAVMYQGLIVQVGPPRDIYFSPRHPFTASFIGKVNLFPGKVAPYRPSEGACVLDVGFISLRCFWPPGKGQQEEALVAIRPESVEIHLRRPEPTDNVVEGRVEFVHFTGRVSECHVRVQDQIVCVEARSSLPLEQGQSVFLVFPPENCLVLADGNPGTG